MKRITALVLILVMLLGLAGCGKSQAVKDAEAAISAIGEVGIDSEESILKAEKLYNILTDSEKSGVSNRLELVEAREAFDELQKELIFDNAKKAYETLNQAADICIKGMDDIYGAWYFGIYKLKDKEISTMASIDKNYVYYYLANETPHFSSTELQKAAESYGINASYVASDWQYCLYVVEAALETNGKYSRVDDLLADVQKTLQQLTDQYGDYEYYPKLKEYYSRVSSYADFFKSPTGSFNQLADTINDYENNIRTCQQDVGFLF